MRLADLQEGFSLEVLDCSAKQARRGRGVRHVWHHRRRGERAVCLSLLVPGKGLRPLHRPARRRSRLGRAGQRLAARDVLDAWVSMVVFTVATVAFYIMGATVLHRQGLHPEKSKMIETLSEMYVPAFGEWTKIFF